MGYVSQYLCKLLATVPLEDIDGIVFSGMSDTFLQVLNLLLAVSRDRRSGCWKG
jgi:hypothetical protein